MNLKKKTNIMIVGLVTVLTLGNIADDTFYLDSFRTRNQVEAASKGKNGQILKVGCIDVERVESILKMVDQVHKEDQKSLWGIDLHTKVMVVDPQTHEFVTNEQNQSNSLTPIGSIYKGKLSEETVIGNSNLYYDGDIWASILYDDSLTNEQTLDVYYHEMFHVKAKELGFFDVVDKIGNSIIGNIHMDEQDARISVRTEWEALYKAYQESGKKREKAIADALKIRELRRKKYECTSAENEFEINEGITEYTASKLTYGTKKKLLQYARHEIDVTGSKEKTSSMVRSFGYVSGILYGNLLDEISDDWKNGMNIETNLGTLLSEKSGVRPSKEKDIAYKNYSYDKIVKEEKENTRKNELEIAEYKKVLEADKQLKLKIQHVEMSFNPRDVHALKGYGSVYKSGTLKDAWGILTIDGGVMVINETFSEARVCLKDMKQNKNMIRGIGWTLKLNQGYKLGKSKDGNYQIVKE